MSKAQIRFLKDDLCEEEIAFALKKVGGMPEDFVDDKELSQESVTRVLADLHILNDTIQVIKARFLSLFFKKLSMEDAGWLFSEDAYPGRQSLTCFLLRPTCDIFAALKWSLGMEITSIKDEQGIFIFFKKCSSMCVGLAKSLFEFFQKILQNPQMNFLANPVCFIT